MFVNLRFYRLPKVRCVGPYLLCFLVLARSDRIARRWLSFPVVAPHDPMSPKALSTFFSGLYYGWRVVGVVTAVRILGGGLHQYGFTVFFLPENIALAIF